jgi:hypothetical protein
MDGRETSLVEDPTAIFKALGMHMLDTEGRSSFEDMPRKTVVYDPEKRIKADAMP